MSEAASGDLALVFSGGGARAAWQVGFLRYLARRFPELRVPVITGVSAGAINAIHVASWAGSFAERVEHLTRLWHKLTIEQVFRVDRASLLRHMVRWATKLTMPLPPPSRELRGLVDTAPLRRFLAAGLTTEDGSLPGIERNRAAGRIRAVALTGTEYASGRNVSWCQGDGFEPWVRPHRMGVRTTLRLEHALASSALPLFFPAVHVGEGWFGDGGIGEHAPLAPAIHLGAERILALSTRWRGAREGAPGTNDYPPPAQVLGVLFNAVFLDLLDQDAQNLERINALLRGADRPASMAGLRLIRTLVVRPSRDLGPLAVAFEPKLPRFFRALVRRLGTREATSPDLVSLLLFQPDYLKRLIAIGEADAEARAEEIERFLVGDGPVETAIPG